MPCASGGNEYPRERGKVTPTALADASCSNTWGSHKSGQNSLSPSSATLASSRSTSTMSELGRSEVRSNSSCMGISKASKGLPTNIWITKRMNAKPNPTIAASRSLRRSITAPPVHNLFFPTLSAHREQVGSQDQPLYGLSLSLLPPYPDTPDQLPPDHAKQGYLHPHG
ncbi:hypothetical protein ES703_17862 [subsurface metagenome]